MEDVHHPAIAALPPRCSQALPTFLPGAGEAWRTAAPCSKAPAAPHFKAGQRQAPASSAVRKGLGVRQRFYSS